MLRINNIRLSVDEDVQAIRAKLQKLLGTADFRYEIERESLDARRRNGRHELSFFYRVAADLGDPVREKKLAARLKLEFFEPQALTVPQPIGRPQASGRPLVAGFGPAGLFAAYLLAREGYRPIVFERGDAVEERRRKVEAFWSGEAALDPESNVQFGEGGAGTFSDGKLTSRSKDPKTREVKRILVEHGAPPEILYSFMPHIGTDLLEAVVRSMREAIIRAGGEVRFRTPLLGLEKNADGDLKAILTSAGRFAGPLFLGIGHSARDTFRMLIKAGLRAEAKDFAVGFRIEHSQAWLDRQQYGRFAGHPRLGAAAYQVHSDFYDGRNAYSFCMCPGGRVIAAASEAGRLVTNGMSYHARDGHLANSAILTGVKAGRDFGRELTDGLVFQEITEAKAFALGGGAYHAPVMRLGDFYAALGLERGTATETSLQPSYAPGSREADLTKLYSRPILLAIARGLKSIDARMNGFGASNIPLTAAETRSSSPLRFVRDQLSRQAEGFGGIYPIGEGAGYAGGIVSAALDGLNSAARFIEMYRPAED